MGGAVDAAFFNHRREQDETEERESTKAFLSLAWPRRPVAF